MTVGIIMLSEMTANKNDKHFNDTMWNDLYHNETHASYNQHNDGQWNDHLHNDTNQNENHFNDTKWNDHYHNEILMTLNGMTIIIVKF
jgi:hypothetical protein